MEIDLLKNYPKSQRDTKTRLQRKTEQVRAVARQFGRDFFDGDRQYGYGGFSYHPRFWQPVVPDLVEHFQLKNNFSVLDIGCAKGFFLYDVQQAYPAAEVFGVDVSAYAVGNAKQEVKGRLQVACASRLPFPDNAFDLVISVNTVHNLEQNLCGRALQEIVRVSKGPAFISVDAYRDETEKERMFAWNLTARTIMHVDEWRKFFSAVGYTGDYYWFIP